MARYLQRRGALESDDGAGDADGDAVGRLEASAVSGQVPPAGPQWVRGLRALDPSALAYDKPLCASLDGFTLHAATRAGALDTAGREALLRYVLRPPVAQERIEPQQDGLIAITLKRAYADGTVAIVMDPLSLLCRLAMSVPPPRYHTVKYAGVLASASPLRSRIAPVPALPAPQGEDGQAPPPRRRGTYRPWAELLKRTFDLDVLSCPNCGGRMKLLCLVTDSRSVARYLRALGEPTDVPHRSPSRGPPFWKSVVLRRKVQGHVA
jgi:Putative transposase